MTFSFVKIVVPTTFMVEMRGFVAEGVIEERVSSLTKAKRQP